MHKKYRNCVLRQFVMDLSQIDLDWDHDLLTNQIPMILVRPIRPWIFTTMAVLDKFLCTSKITDYVSIPLSLPCHLSLLAIYYQRVGFGGKQHHGNGS